MAEESSSSNRDPISLPYYNRGDEGKPGHFEPSTSREAAAIEAKTLEVNDAAFIKRSDLKWTYAVVTEKVAGDSTVLRFEVDKDRNRKSFPEAQWGKYIRVIKVDDAELAKMKEEAGLAEKKEEEAAAAAAEPKEDEKEEEEAKATGPSSGASTGGESTTSKGSKGASGGSWFTEKVTGLFSTGSKKQEKKAEGDKSAAVPEEKDADKSVAETASTSHAEKTTAPSAASVAASVKDGSVEAPLDGHVTEPMAEDPAEAALAATSFPKPDDAAVEESTPEAAPDATPVAADEEPDNTKENSDPTDEKLTQPPTFLPSPKVAYAQSNAATETAPPPKDSALRTPLKLKPSISLVKKNSIVNKLFSKKDKTPPKPKDKKALIEAVSPRSAAANATALGADPNAPKEKEGRKEWFDPEASEVDYDKNPTDLFQALEARQFSYAEEMFKQVYLQFTKECRTWVVARGQKKKDSSHLRFRALPLHAALVFGAPDELVKKILHAYPKATRGRDIKGRLPIHLAMEHNASEEIVALILEAFPKGMFAKDKKEMAPLDYINANMQRVHMKKYLPLITSAKLEDEHAKWEEETQQKLNDQKIALKSDPDYMEDVIATVTDDVETAYAKKMQLLEENYQKEIQLLKKKHDSETQALLEGFEVKLNFERKLQKLKNKA